MDDFLISAETPTHPNSVAEFTKALKALKSLYLFNE